MLTTTAVVGESLSRVDSLTIRDSSESGRGDCLWQLSGVAGHARYTNRPEKNELTAIQAPLGRSEATYGALIPIKKSEEWWNLTQDERRHIFENKSKHIASSLKYLPAVARKLYHSRDLGEPFDFLTWFEFAPEHERDFNSLLLELRSSEEWKYIIREVDIRVVRATGS